MKVVSVWEPWASWIACGVKTIETRMWPTKYRGPLVIHAAKRIKSPFAGQVVAVCELVNCRRFIQGDERAGLTDCEPGKYAWCLKNVQAVEAFPLRGMQGLFEEDFEPGTFEPVDPAQYLAAAREVSWREYGIDLEARYGVAA